MTMTNTDTTTEPNPPPALPGPTPAPAAADLLPAPTMPAAPAAPKKPTGRPKGSKSRPKAKRPAPAPAAPAAPDFFADATPATPTPAPSWNPSAEAETITEMGNAAIVAMFPNEPMTTDEKTMTTTATAAWLTERGKPIMSGWFAAAAAWGATVLRRALTPAGIARARALFAKPQPETPPAHPEIK